MSNLQMTMLVGELSEDDAIYQVERVDQIKIWISLHYSGQRTLAACKIRRKGGGKAWQVSNEQFNADYIIAKDEVSNILEVEKSEWRAIGLLRLDRIYALSVGGGDMRAALAAVEAQMKATGVDRPDEYSGDKEDRPFANLSSEELEAAIRLLSAEVNVGALTDGTQAAQDAELDGVRAGNGGDAGQVAVGVFGVNGEALTGLRGPTVGQELRVGSQGDPRGHQWPEPPSFADFSHLAPVGGAFQEDSGLYQDAGEYGSDDSP